MVALPLAIIVPMLGRPHRVVPLLASIYQTVPGARIVFVVSPHDAEVHAELDRVGAERITVPYEPWGDYARKVNAGYRYTTEPLLFTGADDIEFEPGWYEQASSHLEDGIGVVGTNDLGNPRVIAGDHSTHSLVTRAYADRYGTIDGPGQIYHEGYWHDYCDTEMVETARYRHAYSHAHSARVRHRHPNWLPTVPVDASYLLQPQRMRAGRRVYLRRRHLWT